MNLIQENSNNNSLTLHSERSGRKEMERISAINLGR